MASPCEQCAEGKNLNHLRRISAQAPGPGFVDVMHFCKTVTLIGRSREAADYHLSSSVASADIHYISRFHARVIRTAEAYMLVDSSLTGVYVNDVRIKERVSLQEGDTVTFGHPAGKNLSPGTHSRQPNSPFHFLFEHCHCPVDQIESIYGERRNFPQDFKGPARGVLYPGRPNLALEPKVLLSPTVQTPPMVLPGQAPLVHPVTQRDPPATLAPLRISTVPAVSPGGPALRIPTCNRTPAAPEVPRPTCLSSSPFSPFGAACSPRILRSASPEFTVPGQDFLAATKPSLVLLQEASESRGSSSPFGNSSPESCYLGPVCAHLLPPGPAGAEVPGATDHDDSENEKTVTRSEPCDVTLELTPVFQREVGGTPDGTLSFIAENPAVSASDQDEEMTDTSICQSVEEAGCHQTFWVSGPDTVEQGVEELGMVVRSTQTTSGSVSEHKGLFKEEPLPEAARDGVKNRADSPSVKMQMLPLTELGHVEHDLASRTRDDLSSGVEQRNYLSTKLLSQDELDSEDVSAVLPPRNVSCGTQSGCVNHSVNSQNIPASEGDVEMDLPTVTGLLGPECGDIAGFEPEDCSAVPVVADRICNNASLVEIREEAGIHTDGVKTRETEVIAESLKDVASKKTSGNYDNDSESHGAKELLFQQLPQTPVTNDKSDLPLIAASERTRENLPFKELPETHEEMRGLDLQQAGCALERKVIPAEDFETSAPEPPGSLGEVPLERCLPQSDKILFGNQVQEMAVAGEEIERANSREEMERANSREEMECANSREEIERANSREEIECANSREEIERANSREEIERANSRSAETKNSDKDTVDSRLHPIEELREDGFSLLGVAGVPVVESSREQPSYKSGSGRKRQRDSEYSRLPGGEESEVKRRASSTTVAAGVLEDESRPLFLQGRVTCSGAAEQSSDLADREGDSSQDDLEGERICRSVGIQLPPRERQKEAGGRLVSEDSHLLTSENSHLLTCGAEDEQGLPLEEEESTMKEDAPVRASPAANFPLAKAKVELLNDGRKPCGPFSECSSSQIDQEGCPLFVVQQELEPCGAEPESLGSDSEARSQETDIGRKLLYLADPLRRDGASEGTSEPDPTEEHLDIALPKERGWSSQTADPSHCSKETGSSLPSVAFLYSEILQENVSGNLPRETQEDSGETLGDELQMGNEERDQLPSASGPSGLPRGRGTSLLGPIAHLVDVSGKREACTTHTGESTIWGPSDLTIREAGEEPLKGMEMLNEPAFAQQGQGQTGVAVSPADTAGAEAPSPLAKRMEAGSEELEDEAGEDTELKPNPNPHNENAGLVFIQDTSPVGGQFPSTGPLEKGPDSPGGFDRELACLESCKTLLQEKEEWIGFSRKRPICKSEVLTDSEAYACCQKKLCVVDSVQVQGPACDQAVSPVAPLPSTRALKNYSDQFGKAVEMFLEQNRNWIALCPDNTEGNRNNIGWIVRNYFKSNIYSNELATEKEETDVLPVFPEAAIARDIGGASEGGIQEVREGAGSPEVLEKVVPGQRASPDGECSAWPGPSTQGQGKESEENVQEACDSEEDHFQLRVGSVLEDSHISSSLESPNTELVEACSEEETSSSSMDTTSNPDCHEPSLSPHSRSSDGILKVPVDTDDSASETSVEWDNFLDADWSSKDSRMSSDVAMSRQEGNSSPPKEEEESKSDCQPTLFPSEQESPDLQPKDGELNRGGNVEKALSRKHSEKASTTDGEEEQLELVQTKEHIFLQGSPVGSPGQDNIESAPAAGEPSPSSPREPQSIPNAQPSVSPSDLPLEAGSPHEEHSCQDGGRSGSPSPPGTALSAVAAGPLRRPKMEDSCKGSSTSDPWPIPAEGSFRPKSLPGREGSAQADEEAGSSLLPLPSAEAGSSAGMAAEVDTGASGSEKGLCRLGKQARQTDVCRASREALGSTGTACLFPATRVCSEERPSSPLALHKRGSRQASCSLGDAAPVFQVFKAKRDLKVLEDQLLPRTLHPTSSFPLFHNSQTLKASTDNLSEKTTSFGGGVALLPPPFEKRTVAEPSDSECLLAAAEVVCPAALGSGKSAPVAKDHPQSRCSPEGAESFGQAGWAASEQDVALQLQECQLVLEEILRSLSQVEGIDQTHLERWRDQIAVLQKATKMPKTHIAVVGNTGAGKSSLLNALLDEEGVLPTSAMRACTAVVVEISRAAGGSPYEADVEFLSREEWEKELKALLEDMKDKAGNLKRRCPDRKTEAGAAYSRVKAVYGRVEEMEQLQGRQEVTRHLGTVQHISAQTAEEFRRNIEKFIDSRTDSLREMKGGELWPIVKCVRVRLAKAEVLQTGAVLVDLPGIRDSNAARDTTAREYLKDCHAVWVTASITRAVDDKTAKEMLSENFRRQLLMDGLYGSLAFVCTKTDSFNVTDIIRDLSLQDEIQPIEDELRELESQKMQAEREKNDLYSGLQQEEQPRDGGEATDPAWPQRHDILEKEFRIYALQQEKETKLRTISLICVQARNAFSKQRILMDFSAGLEEMTRRASFPECEEDGDEEGEEGDPAGAGLPDGVGEATSQPGKIQVFTVSSTEYLKLLGKLLRSGPPQVFQDIKDTEIPALRKFASDTALKHSMLATEKVIRDVARVLSQMVNYLTSQRAEDTLHQSQVQDILLQSLQDLPALLQEALSGSLRDIQDSFGDLLASLKAGARRAVELSEAIVKSWGSPVSGFPHSTYRAICNHLGVYTSPKYQCVDFNRQLADPFCRVISVAWSEVFGSILMASIECFTNALLAKLKSFFRDLGKKLCRHGQTAEAVHVIYVDQMEAARARLLNFSLDQVVHITKQQRAISRLLIPEIQAGMEPAYAACSQLSGPGYFQRMREVMEGHIHKQKDVIFESAVEKLWQKLDLLQQAIQVSFQNLVQELTASLRMQLEPLLKPVQKNREAIPGLLHICAKVDKLCRRSGVDYLLPSSLQWEACSPGTERMLPWNGVGVSIPASSMDLRVGAISLPPMAVIEVSKQDIVLTLEDGTARVALHLQRVSHWEFCPPLASLILYVSSRAARDICCQCRVPASSPDLSDQEGLVVRDTAQDQRQLSKLIGCLSARPGVASRGRTLGLQQGRQKLRSLGVCCPGQPTEDPAEVSPAASAPESPPAVRQQPHVPPLRLHPQGRKRAGEAAQQQQQEKQPRGPEECPLLRGRERADVQPPEPQGPSAPVAALGDCRPRGTQLPDAPGAQWP